MARVDPFGDTELSLFQMTPEQIRNEVLAARARAYNTARRRPVETMLTTWDLQTLAIRNGLSHQVVPGGGVHIQFPRPGGKEG